MSTHEENLVAYNAAIYHTYHESVRVRSTQHSPSSEVPGFTYLRKATKYRETAKARLMKRHKAMLSIIHDAFCITPARTVSSETATVHQRLCDRASYSPPASVDIDFVFPNFETGLQSASPTLEVSPMDSLKEMEGQELQPSENRFTLEEGRSIQVIPHSDEAAEPLTGMTNNDSEFCRQQCHALRDYPDDFNWLAPGKITVGLLESGSSVVAIKSPSPSSDEESHHDGVLPPSPAISEINQTQLPTPETRSSTLRGPGTQRKSREYDAYPVLQGLGRGSGVLLVRATCLPQTVYLHGQDDDIPVEELLDGDEMDDDTSSIIVAPPTSRSTTLDSMA